MFQGFRFRYAQDRSGTGPEFILQEHLWGRIISEGLIYGPTAALPAVMSLKCPAEPEGRADFGVLFCRDLFHDCMPLDFYVIVDSHLSMDPSKTQAKILA